MAIGPKPVRPVGAAPVDPAAIKDAFGKMFPTLIDWLTDTAWEGGEVRKTATLFIFWEDGRFKVWLNDRDADRTCCYTAPGVVEALAALEAHLLEASIDWRIPKRRR